MHLFFHLLHSLSGQHHRFPIPFTFPLRPIISSLTSHSRSSFNLISFKSLSRYTLSIPSYTLHSSNEPILTHVSSKSRPIITCHRSDPKFDEFINLSSISTKVLYTNAIMLKEYCVKYIIITRVE